jgi:hypothetical protein
MAVASKTILADDAYTRMISMLEEGTDQSGEVVPLDVFLEHEDWAHMILRPRQRLLAKVIDNAANHRPLDTRLARYPFDAATMCLGFDGEKLMRTMGHCVEQDDAGVYWYDEVADWAYLKSRKNPYAQVFESLDDNSSEPRTIVLIIGRGGGKTTFAAGTAGHQGHRILSQPNPHALFNLAALKALRIQNVATSAAQAGEFFDAFVSFIERVKWFNGRYSPPIKGMMKFGKHLWAERGSSNSKSGRGRDTVVYIHDEIAFAEKTSGPRSDRALYTAIRSAVKTRAKGKGIVLILSSPAEADGVLYELYCQAIAGTFENALVVQLASWEMIPGETKDDYAAEYRKDPDVAETEYGAQFFTGAKNLLPNVASQFEAMVKLYTALTGRTAAMPLGTISDRELEEAFVKDARKYERVVHVDTSEGGDRLVVAVGHVRKGVVVIDLIRAFNREVGYTKELLPFIKRIAKRVTVTQVSFDQFSSIQMIQDLEDMGINAIKTTFTDVFNDELATNFKQLVFEERLALPETPPELWAMADKELEKDGWDDDETKWPIYSIMLLKREMMAALKSLKGRNTKKKRLIAAHAPTAGPVQTDDALDAVMVVAHQAITRSGGASVFFDLPRGAGSVQDGDRHPQDDRPKNTRDVWCPHHKGHVEIDATEKVAPCPVCDLPIQSRL